MVIGSGDEMIDLCLQVDGCNGFVKEGSTDWHICDFVIELQVGALKIEEEGTGNGGVVVMIDDLQLAEWAGTDLWWWMRNCRGRAAVL
jgi:hypothetical protein